MIQISSSARKCFRPFGYLYQWAVQLRNFCFDQGWLRGKSYPIPVICVGNITAGGTGKTPHVELILECLTPTYRVAVLTRGYGRKRRGLVIADEYSTVRDIGDEPRQIKRKYPEVIVAVDGHRRRAMDYLMGLPEAERPQVVVMDDGFQHRYIRPSYSIVLTDATRPIWDEKLLPQGLLREPLTALGRADCVIATKCPPEMSPIEHRIIKRNLNLYPHQRIYFSRIKYQPLRSLLSLMGRDADDALPLTPPKLGSPIVQLSGIARVEPFAAQLRKHYHVIGEWTYPDHHRFSERDVADWVGQTATLSRVQPEWCIICTEKDAMRLVDIAPHIPHDLLSRIYYLPIGVQIIDKEKDFLHLIERLASGHAPQRLYPNRYD